ncbi:ethanolamine utilization phosphate acetyltransferase EutD [Zhenhengia yiwuensis]|uniref:ethanolamine utilization phosphate acetyltransferase EutD n=1 Tax=Zhenhengia yiwuensis TaxID=2763666 RepID=UPI002A74C6BF|nr:ethanolamine utilization phosphate acetyltransferase EutD [Zhenhengia yiwuensis]MDY3369253.1 ethanolamine utilization phosphate acetyltransferase EutD [Zhenhengia yiwuensis]
MTQIIERIANEIVNELKEKLFIPVEASGRHIHLSRADADSLFGEGYQFTKVKDLSQPGQYACKERVTVTGPKGSIHNVIVLGPERKQSQMEVSLTDALALGIKAPVRQSGDTKGSPGITVTNGSRSMTLAEGIIVAKRHIHMTPEDAQKFNVKDGEIVKVKVSGSRPVIFEDTVVRVSKDFRTYMHIDYDEANACGYNKDSWGIIVK